MSDEWEPIPEPVTWTLPRPLEHGGLTYKTVTLRAPTAADVLKATAIRGAPPLQVMSELISAVSAENVPPALLRELPEWLLGQMSDYFGEFAGAPAPDPLEQWRAARRKRAMDAAEAAGRAADTGTTVPTAS